MQKSLTKSLAGTPKHGDTAPLFAAVAGAWVLVVAMGIGRFAFTGMYPLMVKQSIISVSGGSLAASANYAGYLIGALLVGYFDNRHAARLCRLALIGTVVCLAALSLPFGTGYIVALRLVAGIMSAIALVGASIWLFHVVGYHEGAPMLFAGVGGGILVSAEIIAAGHALGMNSEALWALLGLFALIFSALAWPWLNDRQHAAQPATAGDSNQRPATEAGTPGSPSAARQSPPHAWSLIVTYGLAGFGYIVTATYLPLLVRHALPDLDPVQIWAAFGLGAAPSCFLWHWLLRRFGSKTSMAMNLLAQAVGVILPVVAHGAPAFIASALLVGGTFVGTVTIAMPAAKQVQPSVRFNIMSVMTAAYGLGQILGPLVSNVLFSRTHSFDQPLMAASVALVVAAIAFMR